jgi:hypothetical protein
MNSSGPPTDLAGHLFDLLDEFVIGSTPIDLFISCSGPAKDLLDAPIATPESASEQHTVIFGGCMLEDNTKFLVRPRFPFVALIKTFRLLLFNEALMHNGKPVVYGQVSDLFFEQFADRFSEFCLIHITPSTYDAES